jgi:hypothetical protein
MTDQLHNCTVQVHIHCSSHTQWLGAMNKHMPRKNHEPADKLTMHTADCTTDHVTNHTADHVADHTIDHATDDHAADHTVDHSAGHILLNTPPGNRVQVLYQHIKHPMMQGIAVLNMCHTCTNAILCIPQQSLCVSTVLACSRMNLML